MMNFLSIVLWISVLSVVNPVPFECFGSTGGEVWNRFGWGLLAVG